MLELFFIFGSDNLIHFHKWQNFREILTSVNVVFVSRGGHNLRKTLAKSHLPKNFELLLPARYHKHKNADWKTPDSKNLIKLRTI
jgi:nicotinic acid mononucleotide adenylyltransferase